MSTLTLAQAQSLMNGALAAARQLGFKPMGVVVVDAAAQVVASMREDGAAWRVWEWPWTVRWNRLLKPVG